MHETSATKKSRRLTGFVIAFLAVGAGLIYFISESPVSKSKLRRLQAGMTTNQVLEILGPPTYIHSDVPPDHHLFWDYDGLRVLRVSFDDQQHFQAYFYD